MDDDDLRASLERLVADVAAENAATERSKTRVLREIAEREATFVGLAIDLSETGQTVVARTSSGRAHRGRIIAVGRDFIAVRDARSAPAFLATGAISSLRLQPGVTRSEPSSARRASLDISLVALLSRMSDDRPRVQVLAVGDQQPVAGQLRAVGRDVVTLRLDGDIGLSVYVNVVSIAEVVLVD